MNHSAKTRVGFAMVGEIACKLPVGALKSSAYAEMMAAFRDAGDDTDAMIRLARVHANLFYGAGWYDSHEAIEDARADALQALSYLPVSEGGEYDPR